MQWTVGNGGWPGERTSGAVGQCGAVTLSWIDLEGASNCRDLGGLPAAGGTTRAGVLVRADALDRLTDADVVELGQRRGLAHVVDLRTDGERAERGHGRLQARGIRYSELAVITDAHLASRHLARAARLEAGGDPAQIMAEGYVELLELGAPALVEALRRIVAPGGSPALVHCSAGKDRTGVLVALLLGAADVDRETIVVDYAATHERMEAIITALQGAAFFQQMAEQVPAFVFGARAETMESFLDALDRGWGGAAGWFTAHGAAEAEVAAWRDLLVAPTAP